jgi:hypothetical protein
MPDLRRATFLGLVASLVLPAQVFAAGGSSGYVSDAPIPWHMTKDDEGRNVIELIPHAVTRLDLQIVAVQTWEPPIQTTPAQAAETTGGDAVQLAATAEAAGPDPMTVQPRFAVPYQALIYWADGTTWVYGEVSELHYARLPVEVDRIEGDLVLFAKGPAQGTRIVSVGAAELFGAETGTGH